jgi:hypothetical protein
MWQRENKAKKTKKQETSRASVWGKSQIYFLNYTN